VIHKQDKITEGGGRGTLESPGTRERRGMEKGRAREAQEEESCKGNKGLKHAAEDTGTVRGERLQRRCGELEPG
jgi:hypothetical protein